MFIAHVVFSLTRIAPSPARLAGHRPLETYIGIGARSDDSDDLAPKTENRCQRRSWSPTA